MIENTLWWVIIVASFGVLLWISWFTIYDWYTIDTTPEDYVLEN